MAETDAQAESEYARHVEYFYHKCLHVPPQWFAPPGNQDYRSLLAANRNPVRRAEDPEEAALHATSSNKGYVIAGSPATVRERLMEEVIKSLRVGNLMVLLQIGSMPHELTLENIDLLRAARCCRACATSGTTRAGRTTGGRRGCAARASRSAPAR